MPEIIIQYSNQKRKDMNYTISMTDILLAVSVGCNLWFLFLLLYERITISLAPAHICMSVRVRLRQK